MRRIRKREAARVALDHIADRLQDKAGFETALRFLQAAEETFLFILESPGVGHKPRFRCDDLEPLLAWRISDFENWIVYYSLVEEGIEIVDVVHVAQDQELAVRERGKIE